jgi:hypothetical protein
MILQTTCNQWENIKELLIHYQDGEAEKKRQRFALLGGGKSDSVKTEPLQPGSRKI